MPDKLKVLVAFTTPPALKELMAASAELELLALRDPRHVSVALQRHPQIAAVVVEHASDRQLSIELLQNVRTIQPAIRRIAVADPGDLSGLFEGLSSGTIDEIVYRPVDPVLLVSAVTTTGKARAPVAPARPVAAIGDR